MLSCDKVGHVNLVCMFKSEGTFIFCMKMYVKVRIHTKMYDMPRIDVHQSTTKCDNLRTYTK